MAGNREIHGSVVLDVEVDGEQRAKARLSESFAKLQATVNVDAKFKRQQIQTALKLEAAKGRGVRVNVDVIFSRAQMQRELKLKASGGRGLKARVDAQFSRAQIQRGIKEAIAGNAPKLRVDVDVRRGNFSTIVAMANGAQKEITDFEKKEQIKRETQEVNSRNRTNDKVRAQQSKGEQDRATARERTMRRLDVLEDQHRKRLVQFEAAAAQRREVINAQLNARLTAQNNLFAQRQELAAQRNRERLQRQANKPILQSVLLNTDRLNSSLADFDRTVSRALKTSLLSFTVWSAGVGAVVAATAGAAIVSFAKLEAATARASAVFAGGAFADALQNGTVTARTFGDTVAAVSTQVQSASKRIALQTLFNPTEIAQGFQSAAQAGLTFKDSLSSLLPVSQFAQNEMLDVNSALELLTGGLAASGQKGGVALGKLADEFTQVGNASNATAQQVAEAFSNQAAAAFRSYGQSAEQALAVINLFGKANQRGLAAGTQTAILIREINNAAFNKAPEAFRKYHIALSDANGQAIPFTQTLGQLGKLFQQTQKTKGNEGVAKLRKELGLTEKSLRGLIILLPQIQKLGPAGLERQVKLIEQSAGAVARQSKPIQDTILFQFQQTLENVQNLFSSFGKGARDELIKAFAFFNGSDGIIAKLTPQVTELGNKFGDLVGRFAQFTQSADAKNGAKILVDSIRITLVGIRDTFRAFSGAFRDGDKAQSTFISIARSVRAFAQLSATVLPAVARIIGDIFSTIIKHADSFSTFAKITLSVYALRKAYVLFIKPGIVAAQTLDRVRKALELYAAAETIGPVKQALVVVATKLGIITLEADAATAAIGRLTAAEVVNSRSSIGGAATGAAQAAKGARRVAPLAGAEASSAVTGASLLRVGQITENTSSVFSRFGSVLSKAAIPLAIVTAAIESLVGVFHGFSSEMDRLTIKNDEIRRSLSELAPLFDFIGSIAGASFRIIGDALGVVGRAGEALGRTLAGSIGTIATIVGDFVGIFTRGGVVEGIKAFGDVLANAIILPFKTAISFILGSMAAAIEGLRHIPGIGKFAKDAADGLKDASRSVNDFSVNMSKARESAKHTGDVVHAAATKFYEIDPATGKARISLNQTATASSRFSKIFGNATSAITSAAQTASTATQNAMTALTRSLLRNSEAARQSIRQLLRDRAIADATAALPAGGVLDVNSQGLIAGQAALNRLSRRGQAIGRRQRAAGIAAQQGILDSGGVSPSGAGPTDSSARPQPAQRQFVDPDIAIQAAIDRLKPARKIAETHALIDKLTAGAVRSSQTARDATTKFTSDAARGYQLTRHETALLAEALPQLDKAIEKQRDEVSKLDEALNKLRDTQLKGTQAFSDAAFKNDQEQKKLQLARLDALAAGNSEGSIPVKAIDAQLQALQTQAERASLTESLQLDPLRRKLEQTFNPIKEDTFGNIIAQFTQLSALQTQRTAALAVNEARQKSLNETLQVSQARFEKIDAAAQRSVEAFNNAQQAAASTATSIGNVGTSAAAGAKTVNRFSTAVENVPSGKGVVDKALKGISQRVTQLIPQFQGSGTRVMVSFTQGITDNFRNVTAPALIRVANAIAPAFQNNAITPTKNAGVAIMGGFLDGLKQGFGDKKTVGTPAWYLGTFIPKWIIDNKGPVAYDATILVPAGQAVMDGFGKGLRDGFSQITGFVKEVGPSLSEFISDEAFSGRTAKVMADIAIGKTPDIEAAFGDLRPIDVGYGPGGPIDPSLSFLHKSLSYLDTKKMAEQLAGQFGLNISAMRFDHNATTKNGRESDHHKGLAADFAVPGLQVPDPKKDALAAAIKPLFGKIFSQIIYRDHDLNRGWPIPEHMNHVHAAWAAGKGFSIDSGKMGKPSVFDIPGASDLVDLAITNAANAYHANLQGLAAVAKAESGYNINAANLWDINAQHGTPSRGLFQFIEPTFNSYMHEAVKANHAAWNDISRNWLDPKAQALTAAWAFTHGKGGAWATASKYFGGHREMGGPVQAGKAYVVGEKRPEIFVPSQSGMILPDANATLSGGGKTYQDNRTINNHVHTQATDADAVMDVMDARTRSKLVAVNFR